jgi:plastocyanin
VRVLDNVFAPRRLRVPRGTTIVWKWGRRNSETHDVLLTRRPRGVRRFGSPSAATDFRFRRKLRKPGAYRFVCTFHEGMGMKVRVRRR